MKNTNLTPEAKTLEFHNTENKCIVQDGKEYWISRSVAVVGTIIAKVGDEFMVLSEKRSMKMDMPGYQSLVCGYMDWDENGYEAVRREAYEETGLDLESLHHDLIFDNDKSPYFVKTDPGENRQNITLNYIFVYDFGSDGHYAMLDTEKFTSDEVDIVEWVNVNDLTNYTWAFEHEERIDDVIAFLRNENVI